MQDAWILRNSFFRFHTVCFSDRRLGVLAIRVAVRNFGIAIGIEENFRKTVTSSRMDVLEATVLSPFQTEMWVYVASDDSTEPLALLNFRSGLDHWSRKFIESP